MGGLKTTSRSGRKESGFALVLAILSLMLLTFLGLTLATTTSTELQIATNYRWSQQALYNAEAGVEYGRTLLANMDWSLVLPPARTATPWTGVGAPTAPPTPLRANTDQWGEPARNLENGGCDSRGNGAGYGVVLDDGATAGAPFQNVTNIGRDLHGSVSIWIRRPVIVRSDGQLADHPDNNNLVLVAEGIAPQRTILGINRAVRVIEVMLSRGTSATTAPCGERTQSGATEAGNGYGSCADFVGAGANGVLGAEIDAQAR